MLACDIHDYFEIICMRKSQVAITISNGNICHGTALNIIVKNKQEFLVLQLSQADIKEAIEVALTDIKQLEALGNKIEKHNFTIKISQ